MNVTKDGMTLTEWLGRVARLFVYAAIPSMAVGAAIALGVAMFKTVLQAVGG